jgi:hypothetical protein
MHYSKIFVILLFYSLGVKAQVKELGIKTGITNSLISINKYDATLGFQPYKTTRGQSFYAHAFAQVYHFNNFSLQAGGGVIERNSKYIYKIKPSNLPDSLTITEQLETRAFFIELDAKLKILIPELPKVIPYLIVGSQYNMLNKQTNTIAFPLQKNYMQGVLGIGADFDIKNVHFFAEYNKFLNFNRNYSSNADYQYKEQSAAFLIGLKFILTPEKS